MKLHKKIAELCIEAAPLEACGVVRNGEPILCRNTSSQPETSFVLSAEDFLKYRPDTIFHSHPTGKEGFSDHDLAVAANMELTSYVYVVEEDRLERFTLSEGVSVFKDVLKGK
jgi:proteasome lid subunit RPN8/RPN11